MALETIFRKSRPADSAHDSLELVKIMPFNSIPFRSLSSDQTADMIKVAAKRPQDRADMSELFSDPALLPPLTMQSDNGEESSTTKTCLNCEHGASESSQTCLKLQLESSPLRKCYTETEERDQPTGRCRQTLAR